MDTKRYDTRPRRGQTSESDDGAGVVGTTVAGKTAGNVAAGTGKDAESPAPNPMAKMFDAFRTMVTPPSDVPNPSASLEEAEDKASLTADADAAAETYHHRLYVRPSPHP